MTNQTSLRRGAICEIKDNEHHERNSIRFLVMKVIDKNTVLVAKVSDYEQAKGIQACLRNGKTVWIRFVGYKVMNVSEIKRSHVSLNQPYETVSSVYKARRDYIHSCIKRARDERIEKKHIMSEMKEARRLARFDREKHIELEVPSFISQNARHPFSGGLVSPR